MASNYRKLGEFLRLTDERNSDLAITNLQGVSINKEFMPSIANIIGTDLSSYKIVRKGQFAYGPVTSRNGDKVSIALLNGDDCIISSSYLSFEDYKPNELLPEYLMLWFMRPEFDRYARFMSNGSAREIFDWDTMCGVELPVPSIEEQRKIVHDYKVITDRIELLKKINSTIENYQKNFFKNFIQLTNTENIKLSDICEISSGKRVPKELDFAYKKTNHPYIRVRDVNDCGYVTLDSNYMYIDDYVFSFISKYIVITNDIVISTIGTVGLIGKINSNLNNANLTENCFRIRCKKEKYINFVFNALIYKRDNNDLDNIIDGSVQAKLPLDKFRNFEIPFISEEKLVEFNGFMHPFDQILSRNYSEIEKLNDLKILFNQNLFGNKGVA